MTARRKLIRGCHFGEDPPSGDGRRVGVDALADIRARKPQTLPEAVLENLRGTQPPPGALTAA